MTEAKVKLNIPSWEECDLLLDLLRNRKITPELHDRVVACSSNDDLIQGRISNYPKTDTGKVISITADGGTFVFKHISLVMTVKEYNEIIERDYPEYLI